MRHLLGLAAFTLTMMPATASSQTLTGREKWADSARVEIEAASLTGALESFGGVKALIERALTAFPNDPLLQHYQGYALYREASLMQGMKSKGDEIRPVLEAAEDVLELSAKKLDLPETHALRSSVIGQLIGSNPLRGMTLGPKSSS